MHRQDRPLEAALEEVARQDRAQRAVAPAAADEGDGARLEEGVEIADGHRAAT
jgi:hypothetical protein